MQPSVKKQILYFNSEMQKKLKELELITEEPLSIRIQGKPYTVVMRTPGNEINHVAGFCLGEGIVDTPNEFETLGFCDEDVNVVTVTVTQERKALIPTLIDRRGFISQTSCGICGKEIVDDLKQVVQPIARQTKKLNLEAAYKCLKILSSVQPLRDKTRASHAAALYNSKYELLSSAEDVGRHNALDKAIGELFLKNRLDEAFLLILSSRISYEMVQKSARAGIPNIMAFSRPTAIAVELASELNMVLSCPFKNEDILVFCGDESVL